MEKKIELENFKKFVGSHTVKKQESEKMKKLSSGLYNSQRKGSITKEDIASVGGGLQEYDT